MVIADDLHVVYKVYGRGHDRGTAAASLLRIIGRKRRASIREVHALRGVSFVANRGDAVGVIGRNGSGKSTLLRAIAGLLPAEEGQVYTTGEAALLGVNAALKEGGRSMTQGRSHFSLGKTLVAAQVAVSVLLLIGAGLFVRTFRNLTTLDAGSDGR